VCLNERKEGKNLASPLYSWHEKDSPSSLLFSHCLLRDNDEVFLAFFSTAQYSSFYVANFFIHNARPAQHLYIIHRRGKKGQAAQT